MEDVKTKKSLGQHWLHDAATLASICDSAGVQSGDVVLEVGPGLGTLTQVLLQRNAKVIAVEFDDALAATLAERVATAVREPGQLSVVHEDILRFDLTTLPRGYKVVANIPYYLTSNLIRVLCESTNPPTQAALLIQKEVAERVVAAPGNMSLLSVSAQYYCQASLGAFVPARLFTPPPKVDSQVLALQFRENSLFTDVDTKQFFRLVRAGFSQKRKTLLNTLSAGLALPREDTRVILTAADIDPSARAQALSLDQWHALYQSSLFQSRNDAETQYVGKTRTFNGTVAS